MGCLEVWLEARDIDGKMYRTPTSKVGMFILFFKKIIQIIFLVFQKILLISQMNE